MACLTPKYQLARRREVDVNNRSIGPVLGIGIGNGGHEPCAATTTLFFRNHEASARHRCGRGCGGLPKRTGWYRRSSIQERRTCGAMGKQGQLSAMQRGEIIIIYLRINLFLSPPVIERPHRHDNGSIRASWRAYSVAGPFFLNPTHITGRTLCQSSRSVRILHSSLLRTRHTTPSRIGRRNRAVQ